MGKAESGPRQGAFLLYWVNFPHSSRAVSHEAPSVGEKGPTHNNNFHPLDVGLPAGNWGHTSQRASGLSLKVVPPPKATDDTSGRVGLRRKLSQPVVLTSGPQGPSFSLGIAMETAILVNPGGVSEEQDCVPTGPQRYKGV